MARGRLSTATRPYGSGHETPSSVPTPGRRSRLTGDRRSDVSEGRACRGARAYGRSGDAGGRALSRPTQTPSVSPTVSSPTGGAGRP